MGAEIDENLIGLKELAEILDRSPVSVRQWIREKKLPRDLRPKRVGGRRALMWRLDQLDGLKEFAEERASRQGWQ